MTANSVGMEIISRRQMKMNIDIFSYNSFAPSVDLQILKGEAAGSLQPLLY